MTFFKAAALAVAIIAAPLAANAADVKAPSGKYALDKTHANIILQVNHLGLSPYTARFDAFDATLDLNVEDPTKSSVTATVDVGSFSTNFPGEEDFDGKVATDEKFLNGKKFPSIAFASKKVTQTSETTATITGDLTMLGVTKEITLDAQFIGSVADHPFAKKPAVGFVASGVIDRTAWGFNHLAVTIPAIAPAQIVSSEVSISIQAEFVKAD